MPVPTPTREEAEEEDLLRITPEMVTLAATMPGREWGIDYEADDRWRMEEDWEYARQNPEPKPRAEEGSQAWLVQIEAQAREEVMHEDQHLRELREDVPDLRRAMRPGRRRWEYLDQFWREICQDPVRPLQEAHLYLRGQRLAWSLQAFDNLNQLEHLSMGKLIDTNRPLGRGDSVEEVAKSWIFTRKTPFQEGTGVVQVYTIRWLRAVKLLAMPKD
jgi:hypothetical protein